LTGQLSTDPLSTVSLSHWQYWVRHVREAVRFADGVTTLHEQGINVLLEIGPKPTLLGMAGQVLDKLAQSQADSHPLMLPSLRDGQADWQQLLTSLGELYSNGVTIDWAGFDRDYPRAKVALPTYPFQRQRYWVDTDNAPGQQGGQPNAQGTNTFADWLQQADVTTLSQRITSRAKLSADDGQLVTKVLESLAAEHRAEQQAAQLEQLFYTVDWKAASIDPPSSASEAQGQWLILADNGDVGAALAQALTTLGAQVHCVDATTPYAEVVAWLEARATAATDALPLRGVVNLWALQQTEEANATDTADASATLHHLQQSTLDAVLKLLQTLATSFRAPAPALWVVTRNTQLVRSTTLTVDAVWQA
ncbi:MAG: hypothetical protein KDE31_15595, partial [Caldilineaceae bacterium]|nr:hypothetical protein [Caldilineaceae bacterium]